MLPYDIRPEGFVTSTDIACKYGLPPRQVADIIKYHAEELGIEVLRYTYRPKAYCAVSRPRIREQDVDAVVNFAYNNPLEGLGNEVVKPKLAPAAITKVYLGEVKFSGVVIGYKIGISIDPVQRAVTLNKDWSTQMPGLTYNVIKVSEPVHNAHKLEKSLHRILRHVGEQLVLDTPAGVHLDRQTELFKNTDIVRTTASMICKYTLA